MTAAEVRERQVRAAKARMKRRHTAYGTRGPAMMDATPVREHIARLRAAGMSVETIAKASGVPYSTVGRVLWGARTRDLPPPRRIFAATGQPILTVTVSLDVAGGRAFTHPAATRRRLQALVASGWTEAVLAARLPMDRRGLQRLMSGQRGRVTVATARRVREVTRQLWLTPPPERTVYERRSAQWARNRAAAKGWVSLLAWDDGNGPHGIDNPDAVPHGVQQGERAA